MTRSLSFPKKFEMETRSQTRKQIVLYKTQISNLPMELISQTNSFLSFSDFLNLSKTCKAFYQFEVYNGKNSSKLLKDFSRLIVSKGPAEAIDKILANIYKKALISPDFNLIFKHDRLLLFSAFLDSIELKSPEKLQYCLDQSLLIAPSLRMCKLLVERGANVNFISDTVPKTALIGAISKKNLDVGKLEH